MMINKYIKKLVKVHDYLASKVLPDNLYSFDLNSGQVVRTMDRCLKMLNNGADYLEFEISDKRIVNYCIYNVKRLSSMSEDVLAVFKYSQVFGKAGVERFLESPSGSIYYEDLFLDRLKLTRNGLELMISEQQHPHVQFINTKYENKLKRRKHNTKVGYYLCQKSTLGWNPHADVCLSCKWEHDCKANTRRKYPELYRLRVESINK